MRRIDRSAWPRWARVMSSGWIVSPLVLVLVLVLAFVGYGFYTRHQKTSYEGGPFGGGGGGSTLATSNGAQHGGRHHAGKAGVRSGRKAKLTSSGTGGNGGSVTAGGSLGGSGNGDQARQGSSTSHAKQPGHSSRRGGKTTTPSTQPSVPASTLVLPRTGEYGLTVSGYEQPKFGPFSPCKNTYPGQATLDIHPASGVSGKAYDFDIRLYPGQPNKHDERHIYRYSSAGVEQTYEGETVTCAGARQSSTVDYSPPQVRVKLPLQVGESWHNHGGSADRTETGDSRVTGKSTITVQGTSYVVYEIKTSLTMTGKETGYRNQEWWFAPSLGIPLKWTEQLHGKRSGANYTEQLTATVNSIPR